MTENKADQDELDAFDARIAGKDGKLNVKELAHLNSVHKKHYIDMVMADDEKMKYHLQHVHEECDKVEDQVKDLEMHMGETEEQWNAACDHLTDVILAAGLKWGVMEDHYNDPID